MHKTHDIRIITGKYTNRDGQEKARYLTIGNIFINDAGHMKIKLDNPHPPIEGGWNGWANVYEIRDEDRIPRGAPKDADLDDGSIPF